VMPCTSTRVFLSTKIATSPPLAYEALA
jgi:hypothetical protein